MTKRREALQASEPVLSCVICHSDSKPCWASPAACMTAVEHAHRFGYPPDRRPFT